MELNASFLCAGDLEDARRFHLAEIELGVDVVVDHEEAVALSQRDDFAVELNRGHSSGRIAGEIQAEQFDARGDAG